MNWLENWKNRQENCTRVTVKSIGSAIIPKELYRQFKIAAVSDIETGGVHKFIIRAVEDFDKPYANTQELIYSSIVARMRNLGHDISAWL
jgi:hypothetical protein